MVQNLQKHKKRNGKGIFNSLAMKYSSALLRVLKKESVSYSVDANTMVYCTFNRIHDSVLLGRTENEEDA